MTSSEPEPAQLTLAEFLLARITEDEDAVRPDYDSHNAPDPSHGSSGFDYDCGECNLYEPQKPSRVLADCAAKRTVVEKLEPYCWKAYCENNTCSRIGCRTLRLLAQPYIDHPDFNTDWLADE